MTPSAMSRDACAIHGPAVLHVYGRCHLCHEAVIPLPSKVEPIPAWMRKTIESFGERAGDVKPMSRQRSGLRGHACDMTTMEQSVFELMGKGLRPIDISEQIGVSPAAVSNTITRLQDKWHVGSREQLKEVARRALCSPAP